MTLRVGVVGLGDIAQKAWLPVITRADGWTLSGAYSPNQQKAQSVCEAYRVTLHASLNDLAAVSDAVFVHSSTSSHFVIVDQLLRAGVDVCVDKPLAATYDQAEQLVELAAARGRRLMVAFNRRFAPRYLQLRKALASPASLRMNKHRIDSVGPHDALTTLLDDYLHVVDTALWLSGGKGKLNNGVVHTNSHGQMLYAEHHFSSGAAQVTTSMHRCAGSQEESILAVETGSIYRVTEMREWQHQRQGQMIVDPVPGWQSTLEQRGFAGAALHFIRCVENQTMPETSGEQALVAQRMIEHIWREANQTR